MKKGSPFFAYRGALHKFSEAEVHNQNEVACSSLFLYFPEFLLGVLLPSYKFRVWLNKLNFWQAVNDDITICRSPLE